MNEQPTQITDAKKRYSPDVPKCARMAIGDRIEGCAAQRAPEGPRYRA